MHYKVNFELNYSRYLDYCELILHCIAFLIWSYLFPSYAHESCHHSFNSIGVSAAVQLPSWHQWVNGQLALYRFDALPRSLSPVTGRLLRCVLAIKRYSNGAKKCDSFAGFLRQRHAQFGHTLIISKQAIVIIIIAILLHGPEAVNCAATLTTSGQTGDEAGRGLFKVKNRPQIANLHKIHSMMSWLQLQLRVRLRLRLSNSGGDQAQCLSNAICKLSMAATDDLTIDNAHLSKPRPTFLPPTPHLCPPLSLSLSHKQRMMVYR